MKIISINVGRPQLVIWNGEPVSTGIFKEPLAGRVMLRTLNLDGDRQADLTVHGGPEKAVYAYPTARISGKKALSGSRRSPFAAASSNAFRTAGSDGFGGVVCFGGSAESSFCSSRCK